MGGLPSGGVCVYVGWWFGLGCEWPGAVVGCAVQMWCSSASSGQRTGRYVRRDVRVYACAYVWAILEGSIQGRVYVCMCMCVVVLLGRGCKCLVEDTS